MLRVEKSCKKDDGSLGGGREGLLRGERNGSRVLHTSADRQDENNYRTGIIGLLIPSGVLEHPNGQAGHSLRQEWTEFPQRVK